MCLNNCYYKVYYDLNFTFVLCNFGPFCRFSEFMSPEYLLSLGVVVMARVCVSFFSTVNYSLKQWGGGIKVSWGKENRQQHILVCV